MAWSTSVSPSSGALKTISGGAPGGSGGAYGQGNHNLSVADVGQIDAGQIVTRTLDTGDVLLAREAGTIVFAAISSSCGCF
jgi:hypothetical protein